MEFLPIATWGIGIFLNVLFSWLGALWIEKKGYPELKWIMFGVGIVIGFVLQLIVITFMPGKRRPVPRRSLHRKLPQARLPERRERAGAESGG